MRHPILALFAVLFALGAAPPAPSQSDEGVVRSLEVTILSTMLADDGIGEWGFAALVEADGRKILFDTGARPGTVLQNAEELGVDLTEVQEVILSHNHGDHTGGLLSLRRAVAEEAPRAISRTHVGRGIFWGRPAFRNWLSMPAVREAYEDLGGRFVEHDEPAQIHPGVWVTGPVPRIHSERNWGMGGKSGQVESPDGPTEDNIPESMSLVINTSRGLVVISGCGHAGMINTLEYARKSVRSAPVHAAVGGFHLLNADDAHLAWTAGKLTEFGIENFIGAHCTGIDAVYQIRASTGLGRRTAVVGAVGASFSLENGIDPGRLAK